MAVGQQIQKDIMEAMKSLKQAKRQNGPCPFSEESLNELFGDVK